jgi:hypothetical protein
VTKQRRTAPPQRTSKTDGAPADGARTTRTTIEVRPSWLETSEDEQRRTGAPRQTRSTIEVRPSWLEEDGEGAPRESSLPFEEARARRERVTRRIQPPPLPEPVEPVDDEPARSAMPPPLPTTPKKKKV